ncbi:MAG: PDZ domain-containing protein, partial [Candidatus Omnitrophica bacterium]|nr:PDZ domain-containing protein [Candidatus Omnitrophota bacterium]
KSDIKEGDLILEFEGKPVATSRDLARMVSSAEVGKQVPLKILRSGKRISTTVKIGTMPKDTEPLEVFESSNGVSFRGMSVENIDTSLKNRFRISGNEGVVVVAIEDNSPAEESGLAVGDVVSKIENKKINNKQDFQSVVAQIKGSCLVKTNRGYFVLKEK